MKVDDRQWQDPDGIEWSDDGREWYDYGRDSRFAAGLWVLGPVVLLLVLVAVIAVGMMS